MLALALPSVQAQTERNADTACAVSVVAGIGVSDRVTGDHGNNPSFWSPLVKALWRPNRRLNIGLQAAWFDLQSTEEPTQETEFGPSDFTADLHAMPLLLVFEMEVWRMHITGGVGASQVVSTITAFGDESVGREWMATYYLGAGYTWMLSQRFGIEINAGVYSITKIDETTGSVSFSLVYDVLRW